jgi:hypothetical protein
MDNNGERNAALQEQLAYFKMHKAKVLRHTKLGVHKELFGFVNESITISWLNNVAWMIYDDIERTDDLFEVSSHGSIAYNETYSSDDGVTHPARVNLVATYNPDTIKIGAAAYSRSITFFLYVDLLDLVD